MNFTDYGSGEGPLWSQRIFFWSHIDSGAVALRIGKKESGLLSKDTVKGTGLPVLVLQAPLLPSQER